MHVHHAIHDDGIEEVAPAIPRRIFPGDLQLRDVGLVDLIECGVLRAVSAAAILLPGRPLGRRHRPGWRLRGDEWQGHQQARGKHKSLQSHADLLTHMLASTTSRTSRMFWYGSG